MTTFDEIMDDAIEQGLANGGVVAGELAATLLAEHPKEAGAWLKDRAQAIIGRTIGDHIRQRGASMSHQAKAGAFARYAESFEEGDLGAFDEAHELDGAYTRVADWTGAEHLQMAEKYHVSAAGSLMREAFHRAVAKKIGKRKTSDVLTAEQYAAMRRRVLKALDTPEEDVA